MAWFLLVIAGLFETGFAVFLKQSHGITRFWPTVAFAACAFRTAHDRVEVIGRRPGLRSLDRPRRRRHSRHWNARDGRPGHRREAGVHRIHLGRCHRPEPFRRHTALDAVRPQTHPRDLGRRDQVGALREFEWPLACGQHDARHRWLRAGEQCGDAPGRGPVGTSCANSRERHCQCWCCGGKGRN
jgi:hypothetical protein